MLLQTVHTWAQIILGAADDQSSAGKGADITSFMQLCTEKEV